MDVVDVVDEKCCLLPLLLLPSFLTDHASASLRARSSLDLPTAEDELSRLSHEAARSCCTVEEVEEAEEGVTTFAAIGTPGTSGTFTELTGFAGSAVGVISARVSL